MTGGEMGFSRDGQDWMGWPTDLGQTAVAVIAKTREEWASRGNASPSPGETDVDRTRCAQPLFRLALDANSSRAGRARGIRARAMRRLTRKFTV
jgi:hypothetical protein